MAGAAGAGARAVPVDQPVAGHAGGARVQHRRAAEHPGPPQLPAGAPGHRADRAAAGARDIEKIRLKLETCRAAGMRVAADDVGSGNAGLRLLAELNFDIIKVDLTLVQRSASSAAVQRRGRVGRVAGRPHRGAGGGRGDRASRAARAARPAGHHRRPGLPARPAGIAPRAGGADRQPRRAVDRRGAGSRRTPACPPGASRSACRSPRTRASRRQAPDQLGRLVGQVGGRADPPRPATRCGGSRRNQVIWRLAYCRVRRAVTATASLQRPLPRQEAGTPRGSRAR